MATGVRYGVVPKPYIYYKAIIMTLLVTLRSVCLPNLVEASSVFITGNWGGGSREQLVSEVMAVML